MYYYTQIYRRHRKKPTAILLVQIPIILWSVNLSKRTFSTVLQAKPVSTQF